jgi:hypothetical protein
MYDQTVHAAIGRKHAAAEFFQKNFFQNDLWIDYIEFFGSKKGG